MIKPPLYHVDAFTERPFAGNPAAVCVLPSWKEDSWLQAVAREMNLSETSYLVEKADHFDLRWFTPKAEVDLCGHATLASAHILWQQGYARGETISFSSRGGILKANRRGMEIELDFPVKKERETGAPQGLLTALGVSANYVGKNQFDYLVEVESEAVLKSISPDFQLLASLPVRGVIATARSAEPSFDFVSRFFAAAVGIDEDQVTGSAYCCLADYWRKRLNKTEFAAYQASARGGTLRVRIADDRVFLGGRAVTVAKGELLI